MPIYEFACPDCRKIFNFLSKRLQPAGPPACPKCGAPDPLLESVEPVNTWSCEICNATWTDSTAFGGANSRANS